MYTSAYAVVLVLRDSLLDEAVAVAVAANALTTE